MLLDHMIVAVNDAAQSARFYTSVLGMTDEGQDGPPPGGGTEPNAVRKSRSGGTSARLPSAC